MTKSLAVASLLLLLSTASSVLPKEEIPRLTVRWHGQAFFTITTSSGHVIAFEPQMMSHFPRKDKIRAEIVCQCHPHADKERLEGAIQDAMDPKKVRVLTGYKLERPGRTWDWNLLEEKVKVGESTYQFRTVGNYRDSEGGKKSGKNASFVVEIDGITFCHLGFLGHTLSDAEVKAIGPVDVLFIPVGGLYVINGADAKEVVAALKPKRYIFPMVYAVDGQPDTLLSAEEFLAGMKPIKNVAESNSFTFVPGEKPASPTTVVLGWKQEESKDKK